MSCLWIIQVTCAAFLDSAACHQLSAPVSGLASKTVRQILHESVALLIAYGQSPHVLGLIQKQYWNYIILHFPLGVSNALEHFNNPAVMMLMGDLCSILHK